jgi:quinone-modifying oxidoreductase subunit QmoB
MDKVGVFICSGCDIGGAVDCEKLEAVAKESGASHVATHACLCSDEGAGLIRKAVDGGEVDGVLVAACSARAKCDVFRFDPFKTAVERCALREQCAWSHPAAVKDKEDDDTQMLAEDLIRMWTVRVKKETLPKVSTESVDRGVLVVGGGLAGMQAALAAAELGHPVVLVEKQGRLGGYLAAAGGLVPERPPYDRLHENHVGVMAKKVESAGAIKTFTGSTLKAVSGQPGRFEVEIETPKGPQKLKAGAIIQATGARPYDASRLSHLGYGKSKDVVTAAELDAMLASGGVKRPSDGGEPKRVVFVQCAGSRDADHLPYCSSECCLATLRQVAAIRKAQPGVECATVYRDLRAPGQYEHFYKAVQESGGALFTRGTVDHVSTEGGLKVHVKESLLGSDVTLDADMVVLATGMVPVSADGEAIRQLRDAYGRIEKKESETQVKDAQALVDKLKPHEGTEVLNLGYRQGPDLPVLRYGFPDSHYICFPYETRRTGIYAAGTLRAPMDPAQAAEDGWGAAMKAAQCIEMAARGEAVHPRAGDVGIADFFLQRCTQCKRCTEECPFGTLNEDVKGTPEYNQLRCRRCGICLGACPERIISFPDYSIEAISSMVKEMSVPEEFEEKPRILALMCENDALPALDEAAARRMQWNPWVRVVPVRCLGSVNNVWLADSLSRGVDGILMLGCKYGDDYQCHYVKGSELANKRMENLQETLTRLSLEAERIRIVQIARNEYARIPQIFDEFAETLSGFGPNPMKGF